jgi:hypothetical protein
MTWVIIDTKEEELEAFKAKMQAGGCFPDERPEVTPLHGNRGTPRHLRHLTPSDRLRQMHHRVGLAHRTPTATRTTSRSTQALWLVLISLAGTEAVELRVENEFA